MYPGHWSQVAPERPAVINARTGEAMTFAELDARSNQLAHYLRGQGFQPGDHIALFMENDIRYFVPAWAAFRSGLYITCINRYLTAEEAAYIVNDSGSRALVTSSGLGEVAAELPPMLEDCPVLLAVDTAGSGVPDGYADFEAAIADMPETPLEEEPLGDSMLYSSGTTGRPKGIKRPLTGKSVSEGIPLAAGGPPYHFDDATIYLSPAPLYHAAPFGFCMRTQALGGTIVMMERFDPVEALRHIEQYRVTHSQWVPTHFVRMLKLEPEERAGFDLSSHRVAIHAAAPCPVPIKQQMIDWWGPIIWEYYAGTERNGSTVISSEEWLERPGSVGQARSGIIRICDEAGAELPTGEAGQVYFEQPERSFEYHKASEKTRSATHPVHDNWTSLGDVGYLDEDGYLFLTDRKAFMIISGGVNIYPQEIEDAMITHPAIRDVAVFGVPNADFGEEVKAVVELADGFTESEELGEELIDYAREHLAHYKAPRSVDFIDELPRLETGKLYKRLLRDRYWGTTDSKIV